MQAYHIESFGSIGALTIREHDVPRPGRREVLVRVHATSLNYRDLMVLRQTYPVPAPLGVVPLSDGAGEVVEIGEGVSRFVVGDRVAGTYFLHYIDGRHSRALAWEQLGSSHDGMLGEYRVLGEESLVKIPAHLSFAEGATLPCAGVTAWSALTGPRPVQAGETVVTLGSGGVALFALQLAKLFGARVIALTSSEAKAEKLRQLGADDVIDYRAVPDWDRVVRELTGGRGADHVIETIGPDTLERSVRATAFDGNLAMIGVFTTPGKTFDANFFAGSLLTLRRIAVGSRASFEAMNRAITVHGMRPLIDRVYPFSEAREAYRSYAAQEHVGKVIITTPAGS